MYFGAEGTGGGCFDGTLRRQREQRHPEVAEPVPRRDPGDRVAQRQPLHRLARPRLHPPTRASTPTPSRRSAGPRACRATSSHAAPATGKVSSLVPQHQRWAERRPRAARRWPPTARSCSSVASSPRSTVSAQQGFARFSPGDRATCGSGQAGQPRRGRPIPAARSRCIVQAPLDIDDTDLIVRLYRTAARTPIATSPVHVAVLEAADGDTSTTTAWPPAASADLHRRRGRGQRHQRELPRPTASNSVTVADTVPPYTAAVERRQPDPVLATRTRRPARSPADSSAGARGRHLPRRRHLRGRPARSPATRRRLSRPTARPDTSPRRTKVATPTAFSVEAWVKTTTTIGRQDHRLR